MLSKIKKIIIAILCILCLTGCNDMEIPQETNPNRDNIDCGYKYTYSCGYDATMGMTRCGYGMFYTCN